MTPEAGKKQHLIEILTSTQKFPRNNVYLMLIKESKDCSRFKPTNFYFVDSFCCWLKTAVPKREPNEDATSGVIQRERYRHPPTGMRSAVPLGGLGTGSFELRADGKPLVIVVSRYPAAKCVVVFRYLSVPQLFIIQKRKVLKNQ